MPNIITDNLFRASRAGVRIPCHLNIAINGKHYDERRECESKDMLEMLPWIELVAQLNGIEPREVGRVPSL